MWGHCAIPKWIISYFHRINWLECYYVAKHARTYTYIVSANDDQTIIISISMSSNRRRGMAMNFPEFVAINMSFSILIANWINYQAKMPYEMKNRIAYAMIMRFNRPIEAQFYLEELKSDGNDKSEFFGSYLGMRTLWFQSHFPICCSLVAFYFNRSIILTLISLVRLNYNFSLERNTNHMNS